MNLDELRSARSRERQKDSLQQLRESFYADASEFVQELREERDRAAEQADDPFDSPEVRRLTDDIKTAESTVEAIYERRVGKLVKMSSLAAAGMATEEEGLTSEERTLFESLVADIETNRDRVLDLLAGERPPSDVGGEAHGGDETGAAGGAAPTEGAPSTSTDARQAADREAPPDAPDPEAGLEGDGTPRPAAEAAATDEDTTEGFGAADAMGETGAGEGGDGAAEMPDGEGMSAPAEESGTAPPDAVATETSGDGGAARPPPESEPGTGAPSEPTPRETGAGGAGSRGSPDAGSGDTGAQSDGEDVDRTTVRITRDVGEIYGVDERVYDLSAEDVVTLPETNAEPLLEREAAEKLE